MDRTAAWLVYRPVITSGIPAVAFIAPAVSESAANTIPYDAMWRTRWPAARASLRWSSQAGSWSTSANNALDLVARRGVENLTTQSVADASHVSIGTVYRYFPTAPRSSRSWSTKPQGISRSCW
ncbi:MAG: helix-turn-helix domain-containing protein [Mycobacterium sp.]